MGRMLQKKKNRSSIPRATQKPKSKRLPIKASPLVSANWNKHLTLSQNYRRLGLTSKLNARSGGTEVKAVDAKIVERRRPKKKDPLAVQALKPVLETGLETAKVVKDESGRILKVIRDKKIRPNPLNDPLAAMDDGSDTESSLNNPGQDHYDRADDAGLVPKLEAAALAELAKIDEKRKPRKQSQREQDWIEELVEKHGNDFTSMSRDKKLNRNQQTEADIRRRVELWQKSKHRR